MCKMQKKVNCEARNLLILIIMMLCFTGCGKANGVQESQPAERVKTDTELIETVEMEPTEISEKEEFVRMVMTNDKLYTDTGEISNILRCGVTDFSFDISVEQGEPKENNQTNFGIGYDGQYGTRENRIEVLIDDEWHIFAYNENNLKGVTMEVVECTNRSLELQVKSESNLDIQYGEDYLLEAYDEEIKTWVRVPMIRDDIAFNDIAYAVKKGNISNWEADWTVMYGELEAGRYRIVKEFTDYYGPGNYITYTLMDEFEIAN